MLLLCAAELPVFWSPPADWGPTLVDIAGRLPRHTDARDSDLITYAHEGNHFLCHGTAGGHAIYIGRGRRWEIPTPPIQTEAVFAAIPHAHRTSIYQTYLRQGQTPYWRDQPLMILDEWRAYTVGSKARQELGETARAETVRHMETFARYADVLYRMAGEAEGYDITEMREFCRWNLGECRRVLGWDCDVRFE